ncbi:hypothetical protein NM208_g5348 [Fusarium decemcellulare]|uniref:Uncharacterized protein n=2 Tax=Fusarium decemcellulare TaxID=57161 RepID=A0ACC1SHD4_9HYPO|nr:hypothetical protein NM208_g8676 [Fusarium decemcellulare]KAJ3539790.1 hypothetical protein NM208_g5348 [Fusarium decemcellulare]
MADHNNMIIGDVPAATQQAADDYAAQFPIIFVVESKKWKNGLKVWGSEGVRYKFHDDGYVLQYKIQGTDDPTLAARTFGLTMVLMAYSDLEAWQFDFEMAFLNANLAPGEHIYCVWPHGILGGEGKSLKLLKELYGLRRSPLLWYEELTSFLKWIGFEIIMEEPCVMTNGKIIIFLFVDDSVMLFNHEYRDLALSIKEKIMKKYTANDLGEIRWCLNIRIMRDRKKKAVWLCRDAYIDKMALRYKITTEGRKRRKFPWLATKLKPYEGKATAKDVEHYQSMVGSIQFSAIITRADISYSAAELAQFLQNPGPDHIEAAQMCMEYLVNNRNYGIGFSRDDSSFLVHSDASFADDLIDRKSTQGYVMKLFGGLVMYKSGKLDTVTTSSTETELLALSQAAKKVTAFGRLCKEVRLSLDDEIPSIHCDNRQTIRLLTEGTVTLVTKLRYVDIHHHWLCQAVSEGQLEIQWASTNDMIAEGLTKALKGEKSARFRDQLGMIDCTPHIEENTA